MHHLFWAKADQVGEHNTSLIRDVGLYFPARLTRILHEGNEAQGKYGKQGWLIVRRFIAVAMDACTDAGGRAKQGCQSREGGSTKIAYTDVGGRAPTVGAFRRQQ